MVWRVVVKKSKFEIQEIKVLGLTRSKAFLEWMTDGLENCLGI